MVPEYAEEPLAVGWRGVMRRTFAALRGLWESKANNTVLTLLSKCSLGLPNVEGIAAPKSSQSDYLYYFFFNIGKSGKSSKIDGYEGYWVIYPLSTVLEERKNNTWKQSWNTWGLLFFKMREIVVFRKDIRGPLGLLLFKSVWEHDTIWPRDVTGHKICTSVIH